MTRVQALIPLLLVILAAPAEAADQLPLHLLELPPGFQASLWARVPDARSLTLGEKGTVFVSTRSAGDVWALRDGDGDGVAESRWRIASGLEMPNGIAFRAGALYVAAVSRILRYDDIESRLDDPPRPVMVTDALPTATHHGWRYIAFGPDDLLYVAVGAPCNVCVPPKPIFATIVRMKADGEGLEIFAHGVRNSVGFDWNPASEVLWFTDNGRDWLGDNLPPDELDRAPRAGMDFGFPYCYGDGVRDPQYGDDKDCSAYTPPALELDAHVAPLGMRFYEGGMFPGSFKGQILLAEHGSWNRSQKIGYRVMLVRVQGDKATGKEPFITGWLQGQQEWGRPVDVQVLGDGSLLVSDDDAGAIYRVTYHAP